MQRRAEALLGARGAAEGRLAAAKQRVAVRPPGSLHVRASYIAGPQRERVDVVSNDAHN